MSFMDKIKRGRSKPIPVPVDEPLASPTPAPRASPTPLGTLPAWATIAPSASKGIGAVVEVDSAQAYPYWLSLLGVSAPDQYWLEVAYQCIKLDVQSALVGTENDPRTLGKPVQINFARAEAFAQKAHPPGRGASLATQGREARTHYVRVRGRMPF